MKMKTMKIWRIAFAMLAAFSLASLASCSSDDDEGGVKKSDVVGTWITTEVFLGKRWIDHRSGG